MAGRQSLPVRERGRRGPEAVSHRLATVSQRKQACAVQGELIKVALCQTFRQHAPHVAFIKEALTLSSSKHRDLVS